MRLVDALGIRIGGKDAIEARLDGQVIWSAVTPAEPLLPGQYRTDFSEYQTGTPPNDWTARWDTNFPYSVVANPDSLGGKALRIGYGGAGGRNLFTWDAIDDDPGRADVDLVMRARVVSSLSEGEMLFAARCSNDSAARATGYRSGMRPRLSGGRYECGYYLNGGFSSFGGTTSYTYRLGEWFWSRYKIEANQHFLKVWAGSHSDEPENWPSSTTQSSITAPGWVGIFRNADAITEVDFFSVGTGGQSAPGPALAPFDTAGLTVTSDFGSGDNANA